MSYDMAHGVVCDLSSREDGYFAWPSVAKTADGTIWAGCSGFRSFHIDPWGKTVLFASHDDGLTFSEPIIAYDSLLDDRDVGLTGLPDGGLLVSWFTLDSRIFNAQFEKLEQKDRLRVKASQALYAPKDARQYQGSWTMRGDGIHWEKPVRCPVSAPHGPIALYDGRLFYVGKEFPESMDRPFGDLLACDSADGGRTWRELGRIPLPDGVTPDAFHEPHAVELVDGTIFAAIRFHKADGGLGVWQSRSEDGGLTWTVAAPLAGVNGTPPHLLRHSSGAIVMTYGYREQPYGQRAIVSYDEGLHWGEEIVLRADGPDGDLGYPCSVERSDGSILTVYYQKTSASARCSICSTIWTLP